jgi:hypothetical protein
MSGPRLTQRTGGLLLTALLSCAQLAPISAPWLGDESCCGCTSALCCRSGRPATPPPPAASKSCHGPVASQDGAVLKCAPPMTDLALPLVARGVLPGVVSLEAPARSGAATLPVLRAPLGGVLRIELPPPRQRLLVS